MKILHVNCNYLDSWLHQTMVETLSSIGVENKVFVPVYSKDNHIVRPNENIVVSECFKKWDRLFYDIKQKKIYEKIRKEYVDSEFSCIHAYTVFTDGNVARRCSEKWNVPYVVAVRNTDVNTFFKYMPHLRKRGVKVLEKAEAVFFLSKAYQEQVLEEYVPGSKREKILSKSYLIPNGIDIFWHSNSYERNDMSEKLMRLAKRQIRILYVGNIDKNKNIVMTLSALDELVRQGWDVSYTVVGKIKNTYVSKKMNERAYVQYLTPKPKEELIKIYRENDIFVMPSHTETFGLVYAEAMSQGLPVIYTRGQGFDKQFEDGMVGYAVSDEDVEELVISILRCVENYEAMSKNCIDGSKRFDWMEISKEYFKIYRQIVDN